MKFIESHVPEERSVRPIGKTTAAPPARDQMFIYGSKQLSSKRRHRMGMPLSRASLRRSRQAGRGRADVSAGAARLREGMGSESYVDARHGQQSRSSLRRSGQAGRGRANDPFSQPSPKYFECKYPLIEF